MKKEMGRLTAASAAANLFLAVSALAAVSAHIRHGGFKATMKYFTTLSNVLCAFACLAVAVCRLAGKAPLPVLTAKYVGTSAVTVTMLTVLFFLLPQYGAKALLGGPDLWLHLLCPILALGSFLAWDHPTLPFAAVLLGMLPVILYGILYLKKTVLDPPDRRWEDFYGFNRNGHWRVSFAAMYAAAFLISAALWAL